MMNDLKQEIMDCILEAVATAARVTVKENLSGPQSADPAYVLPSARSVIAFNVALDRDQLRYRGLRKQPGGGEDRDSGKSFTLLVQIKKEMAEMLKSPQETRGKE